LGVLAQGAKIKKREALTLSGRASPDKTGRSTNKEGGGEKADTPERASLKSQF